MKLSDFRESDVNFMIELLEKGQLTRKTQTSYKNSQSFYIGTWFLRDAGLIKVNGINNSRQNIYELTDFGREIARMLKKINEKLGEI